MIISFLTSEFNLTFKKFQAILEPISNENCVFVKERVKTTKW